MKILVLLLLFPFLFGCAAIESSEEEEDASSDMNDSIFSNIRDVGTTKISTTIQFTTSIPTSCEVIYGTTKDNLNLTGTDPSMGMMEFDEDHSVLFENLTSGTLYYYKAKARDTSNMLYFSEIYSFSTLSDATNDSDVSSDLENIALASKGTTILASSNSFSGYEPEKTIDGNLSSEWATVNQGDGAFITLQLSQSKTVHKIGFRSRKMMDGSSIIQSFQLDFDSGTSTLGPFSTPDPDILYTFDFDPPITAQTIRIDAVMTTGGNTGVKEIQFFAPK